MSMYDSGAGIAEQLPPVTRSYLNLEDGSSFLLLENGGKIIIIN